jgi:hypothetical protein
MAFLFQKATSTCSCSFGVHDEHDELTPRVKQFTFENLNDDKDKGRIKVIENFMSTDIFHYISYPPLPPPLPVDKISGKIL